MRILIRNGRVLDPANKLDKELDVLVEDGRIARVAEHIEAAAETVLDARGMWVAPGLIDLHTHLREPGQTHKETIATGSRAAALGGFTTICAMPNTEPAVDNDVVVEYIKLKAERDAIVNVLPIGAITKGQKGEELAEIGHMAQAGAVALSDDGKGVADAGLIRTAMAYAKMFDLPIFAHCEEPRLSGGQIHAGLQAAKLGLAGVTPAAEEVMIARDIILARETGARLHICHVSTTGGAQLLREAHHRGEAVTAEATPHHFTLCDTDIPDYDANYKMSPPLRGEEDVQAVKAALRDGAISVIATDHAPHHIDDKNCEFDRAANGVVGLETAVPLGVTELVDGGWLTPLHFIQAMTLNPARVLGIDKGTLSVGATADITIIDPAAHYAIDAGAFASKSRNTPFHGRHVKGRVVHTICGGRLVVREGVLAE